MRSVTWTFGVFKAIEDKWQLKEKQNKELGDYCGL